MAIVGTVRTMALYRGRSKPSWNFAGERRNLEKMCGGEANECTTPKNGKVRRDHGSDLKNSRKRKNEEKEKEKERKIKARERSRKTSWSGRWRATGFRIHMCTNRENSPILASFLQSSLLFLSYGGIYAQQARV